MNKEIKFAKRFSEALKNSNYTGKELAKELGLAESNISNWKKGDRGIVPTPEGIADYLSRFS